METHRAPPYCRDLTTLRRIWQSVEQIPAARWTPVCCGSNPYS